MKNALAGTGWATVGNRLPIGLERGQSAADKKKASNSTGCTFSAEVSSISPRARSTAALSVSDCSSIQCSRTRKSSSAPSPSIV